MEHVEQRAGLMALGNEEHTIALPAPAERSKLARRSTSRELMASLRTLGAAAGHAPYCAEAALLRMLEDTMAHGVVRKLTITRRQLMASRKRYQLDRVTVEPGDSRPATWTFAGEAVSGTEQTYAVVDGNFPGRNAWEFMIRIPKARGGRLEVRPRTTPNLKVWAELTDRSLTFARATKGEARGRWYCQVALADPTGARTKDVVKGGERGQLPPWFGPLQGRMRLKQNVRPTRGTDGDSLVVLVPAGDHAGMIRLFFATKVWVLKERVSLA